VGADRRVAVAVGQFGGVVGRGLSQVLDGARDLRVVGAGLDHGALEQAVADGDVRVVVLNEASVSTSSAPTRLRGAGMGSHPPVGIVGLVHRPTRAYATRLLGYGVSVCLSLDAPERELVRSVRLAAEGGHAFVSAPPSGSSARSGRLARVVGKHALTRRERQVLELLNRGERNAEIARALQISTETARTHVKHVLCKLGVRSREELLEDG
jgi:DNA-binding NarL/FixJ family response regulator